MINLINTNPLSLYYIFNSTKKKKIDPEISIYQLLYDFIRLSP
jgi:hypothetical protein